MFQFVGYDFFSGPGSLRYAPNEISDMTNTKLQNAIFDHFGVTHDLGLFGETKIPTEWTYDTILNATFNGTTGAGNLEYAIKYVDGIKIKRRVKPSSASSQLFEAKDREWITLDYIKINTVDDLIFTFNDFLNAWGVEYEYALVPVINGIEGRYIVNSVISDFNGVFIGDAEQAFKFLYDVSYSSNIRKQQTGVFAPLGKEFPIVVANGVLSYEVGNVSGTVIDDDFERTGKVNKLKTVVKKNNLKDFLTNKKPKVLKDWNGNIWLIIVTNDVPIEYKQGSGMSIPTVSINWTEIGKTNNQQDLYDSGLINVLD